MPVPESGIPAAQGYARASGIPYGDGFVKNRYVGRTFIQPSQKQRGASVRLKLNPLPREHPGQAARRRRRLDRPRHHHAPDHRDAARGRRGRGALPGVVAAVPLAVLLRPRHRPALRAARRRHVGRRDRATTSASTRSPTSTSTASSPPPARRAESFCTACLTGDYPVPVPEHDTKLVLEDEPRTPARRRARAIADDPPRDATQRRRADRLTYADAGVDIAAGEKAVELIKDARALDVPARGRRRHRRVRRAVRARLEALPTTRCSCRRPTASARSR